MGRDALSRLFGIAGGFVSLYALSAWSLSQGGTALSAVPGLEPRAPAQSAYFAIIIIGIVLFATASIGIAHISQPAGAMGWRFPIVGLGDAIIDRPRALSTRLYVTFLSLWLLVLPAAALVHLNRQLVGNGWIWNERLPAAAVTNAACALPFWPFGSCKTGGERASADAIIVAPEVRDGMPTTTPARLWLASHPCDLQWERGLAGPQTAARLKEGGPLVSASEQAARRDLNALPGSIRDALRTALSNAGNEPGQDPGYCAGTRDRSALCKQDEAKCRGVAWLRLSSPVLVIVPSLLGWGGVLAFFLVWWRLERKPDGPPPAGASKEAVSVAC